MSMTVSLEGVFLLWSNVFLIFLLTSDDFVVSFTISSYIGMTKNLHPNHQHRQACNSDSAVATAKRRRLFANECDTVVDWKPQDLTRNNPGHAPLPSDDYIRQYQQDPSKYWPVEFFVLVHRRRRRRRRQLRKTSKDGDDGSDTQRQILVRMSANGTSRWGLGSGVPVTRWMPFLCCDNDNHCNAQPPKGYQWASSESGEADGITVPASLFPQFRGGESWTYRKINLLANAFSELEEHTEGKEQDSLVDEELEEYARQIINELQHRVTEDLAVLAKDDVASEWERSRLDLLRGNLQQPNSIAAVQGSLRMSGICQRRRSNGQRFIDLQSLPPPAEVAQSMRLYTMFPQMPDPLPHPLTSANDLQAEISTRQERLSSIDDGKQQHCDRHGRVYTHISTSNVSNTIHGVYLSIDATQSLGDDEDDDERPPALDLFGNQRIEREWKSLEDLKVLRATTEDPKPTFISGFIVQQLVREGVIPSQ